MTIMGPSSLSYFPLWGAGQCQARGSQTYTPKPIAQVEGWAQGWCLPVSSGEFGPSTAREMSVPSRGILLTPKGARSWTSSSLAPGSELN